MQIDFPSIPLIVKAIFTGGTENARGLISFYFPFSNFYYNNSDEQFVRSYSHKCYYDLPLSPVIIRNLMNKP